MIDEEVKLENRLSNWRGIYTSNRRCAAMTSKVHEVETSGVKRSKAEKWRSGVKGNAQQYNGKDEDDEDDDERSGVHMRLVERLWSIGV